MLQYCAAYFSAKLVVVTFFCLLQQNKDEVKLKYNEDVRFQKLDQEIVSNEFKRVSAKNYLVLICGTKSFDKDVMNYFLKCGAVAKRLFKF